MKSLQMKDEYTYSMDKNELMNRLRTQQIEENQRLIQSMLNEMAHNGSIYQQKLRQASLIITEMIKIDKNSVGAFRFNATIYCSKYRFPSRRNIKYRYISKVVTKQEFTMQFCRGY